MLSVSARQVFLYYFDMSLGIRLSGSAIRYPLSGICYPVSAIRYPLSAFSTMPEIVEFSILSKIAFKLVWKSDLYNFDFNNFLGANISYFPVFFNEQLICGSMICALYHLGLVWLLIQAKLFQTF